MKKLSILCSSLLLALMMCFPVFASEDLRYVEDNADLLTVSEQQELNDTLTEISERQGVDVGVITANDMGDKSIEDYAKAKYEERGYGDDGVLLVVNMEVRKWWMSTYRKGTTAISSEGISTIGSEFAPYLSNGEYASAFDTYARLCDDYISKAPNLAQEYAQALGSLTSLQDGLRFVNDDAHLLTKDERKELNDTLTEIGKRQGLDVALLTTKDTGGKAILDYAMTMYEALNYGQGKNRDGVLLVVNMETRKFWMATHGYGITAFTDAGIQYIGEEMTGDLSDGDFAAAFDIFADECDDFITQAKTGEPYDIDNEPQKPMSWIWIPISLVAGIVLSLIVVGTMKSKLKTVRFQAAANNYVKAGSMNLTESRDIFLYNTMTKTKKEKNDSSSGGGGSSTHTTSSGSTAGGGGGKF